MKNPGVLDWIQTHDSSIMKIAYWRSIHSSTGTPLKIFTHMGTYRIYLSGDLSKYLHLIHIDD